MCLDLLHPAPHGNSCCALVQAASEAPPPPPRAAEEVSHAVRLFSMEEVERHDTRDSAWFVHKGEVRALLYSPTGRSPPMQGHRRGPWPV